MKLLMLITLFLTLGLPASADSLLPLGSVYSRTLGSAPVTFIRNLYSSTNVTTSAYVQLIASTSGAINALEIFDSSGQVLKIAFGASGSEVDQFQITPGGNGYIPVAIPAGTRVSIKAVSANATAGELDINAYY